MSENINGSKRPYSAQNPELAPENAKKPKLQPSINSHNNTPITSGCSKTPPGQELCADSTNNPVVVPENARRYNGGPPIDPYDDTLVFPGCSKTPPGQEFIVAYKKVIRNNPKLCEKLSKFFEYVIKILSIASDDSPETTSNEILNGTYIEHEIVTQAELWYLSKMTNALHNLKNLANYSYYQSTNTGNVSEKKNI